MHGTFNRGGLWWRTWWTRSPKWMCRCAGACVCVWTWNVGWVRVAHVPEPFTRSVCVCVSLAREASNRASSPLTVQVTPCPLPLLLGKNIGVRARLQYRESTPSQSCGSCVI